MKKIIFNDIEFQYEIHPDGCTHFYKGTEFVHSYRNLFFEFGKMKEIPKMVFWTHIDIEDPNYSKNEVIKYITKAFNKWQRELEIERGEIL